MPAVTICSDFRAQEEEICHYYHLFLFCLPRSNGARPNGMDLTEAEDIKKRWQEYTELYIKDLNDPGKQWKQWQTLFSWAPKSLQMVTADMKRHVLLGQKDVPNLDCVLKSRDITLQTKVHLFKAIVFPVVMYGCENWTIKKAEHRRTDAFKV